MPQVNNCYTRLKGAGNRITHAFLHINMHYNIKTSIYFNILIVKEPTGNTSERVTTQTVILYHAVLNLGSIS